MDLEFNVIYESACEFIFHKYYRFEVKLFQIDSFSSEIEHDICMQVDLSGEINGRICLISSREAAAELTSRIMGLDPESAKTEAESGLKELLNIICGRIKQMMEKDRRNFSFGLPQKGEMNDKGFQFWIKAVFKEQEAAVGLFIN